MLAEVLHSYRKFVEPETDLDLGNSLIAGIGGHTTQFPTADLPMTLSAFGTIQTDYGTLITAANGGDATAVSARNVYRANTWLPAVELFATFVDQKANHDPSIILMSGFHATKVTADHSVVPVQMALTGSSPGAGQFSYESKTKVDSHSFTLVGIVTREADVFQDGDKIIVTTNKASKITFVNTNNKRGLVTGLDSETKTSWVIIAKNPAGSGLKSNEVTLLIQ